MKTNRSIFYRWLCSILLALSLSACASSDSFLAEDSTSVTGVGHIGRKVGIPEFYVNGTWGGSASGWGGGGATTCCVKVPKPSSSSSNKPAMVTVKWKSCDISHIKFVNGLAVDPDSRCISEWHESTVPVHFAVPLGKSSGFYIHFLPENRVEAWVTEQYPESPNYPGPAYPRSRPGPDYASPLDDKRIDKKAQP